MALLPINKYFVFNSELKPVEEFVPSENEGGVYEVIRVMSGVPLFLDDHLSRFNTSAKIAGKTILFTPQQVKQYLENLIEHNRVVEGNILLSCKTNLKAFFIAHKYPTEDEYKTGVKCGILEAERNNPNAKLFQTSVRKKANQLIKENRFYEVLLVDHLGKITEGSRSNLFFIKGDKIITPPPNKVLLGITRQKTLLCAQKLGFNVLEEEVLYNNVDSFDAVFITGTSPKILPVRDIGEVSFNTENRILRSLMNEFDIIIKEYIKNA